MELELNNTKMQGLIHSWAWIPGIGWQKYSSSEPSFPSEAGFGCTVDITTLAAAVKNELGSGTPKSWDSITTINPELKFLMPKQFSALIKELSSEHKIGLVYDSLGKPVQLGLEILNG